jgi:hypothetical protein
MTSPTTVHRLIPIAGVVLGVVWVVLAVLPGFQADEIRRATLGPILLLATGLIVAATGFVGAGEGSPRWLRAASLYSIAIATIGIVRLPDAEVGTTGILIGIIVVAILVLRGIGPNF